MVFLSPARQAIQQRWTTAAATVVFEDLPPVSLIPHGSGTVVGAQPVVCHGRTARGGQLERDAHAADNPGPRAPDVTGLAGQPVRRACPGAQRAGGADAQRKTSAGDPPRRAAARPSRLST